MEFDVSRGQSVSFIIINLSVYLYSLDVIIFLGNELAFYFYLSINSFSKCFFIRSSLKWYYLTYLCASINKQLSKQDNILPVS